MYCYQFPITACNLQDPITCKGNKNVTSRGYRANSIIKFAWYPTFRVTTEWLHWILTMVSLAILFWGFIRSRTCGCCARKAAPENGGYFQDTFTHLVTHTGPFSQFHLSRKKHFHARTNDLFVSRAFLWRAFIDMYETM